MQLPELVHDPGFQSGLVAGSVALVMIVALALVKRFRRRGAVTPLPVAGVALVATALIALNDTRGGVPPNDQLVFGLVLLAVGPLVADLAPSRLITILSTVPGAAFVAWSVSIDNDIGWVGLVAFLATVVGAALVTDFDRANSSTGLGLVLMALTTLSAYTALPDTEQIAAMAGAALPIALLGTPVAVASLGSPGAASAVGLFVWVAAIGGRARPGSFIGALACLGLMLVEPIVRRILPLGWYRGPRAPLSLRALLIVALDAAVVAGTSRIAGLETSALAAAGLAALLLIGAAIVLGLVLMSWGRNLSRRSRATAGSR